MDRLEELDVLVAVVESGSLVGAARRLRRSPPAITRALAALENRVGLRLVERTTRRLAPTDAGRQLAERGRRILADYEGSVNAATTAPLGGTLRITAPVIFGRRHVTPVVLSFLDSHPAIDVDLVLHDRNQDLIEERIHLAVRIGRLADSGLVARRVGHVRRVLVAAPDYLARRGEPVHPRDLPGHDTILPTGVTASGEWTFLADGRPTTVRVAARIRISESEAAIQAARSGHGITRALSYQVRDDVAAGRLVRLLSAFEPEPLPVQLVVPSGHALPPKVRAFHDHAVAAFQRLDALHE